MVIFLCYFYKKIKIFKNGRFFIGNMIQYDKTKTIQIIKTKKTFL